MDVANFANSVNYSEQFKMWIVSLAHASTECPASQIKQGEINGSAVCKKECADPNQAWGFVNGVEGCYGAPSCPAGGSYGYVNGVGGCYGSNSSSGSNTSSGGGTSSGSQTSTGGGGTSSGSQTSSGGGSGGGDEDGGHPSAGGGNDAIGSDYSPETQCPSGFQKSGNKCVSTGKGDCPVGYHELVVSSDPFLFVCVQDNPPQGSSAPSPQPNSSAASSPNSSAASSTASGSSGSASGGGGSSSGSGDDPTSAGDCDPTAADYFQCAGLIDQVDNNDIQDVLDGVATDTDKSLRDYEKLLKDDMDKFKRDGVPFKNEPSQLRSVLLSFLQVSSPCNPPSITFFGQTKTLSCDYFNIFKQALGWFLAVLTGWQIWQMAIRPVER